MEPQTCLPPSSFICMGVFGAPYGVKGAIRVKSFTERPSDLFNFSPLYWGHSKEICTLHPLRIQEKKGFIVQVQGMQGREHVNRLKSEKIYVSRHQLPELKEEGTFYYEDLIGLTVRVMPEKTTWGWVKALHNFGAGDLLEIEDVSKRGTCLIPFSGDGICVVQNEKVIEVQKSLLSLYVSESIS